MLGKWYGGRILGFRDVRILFYREGYGFRDGVVICFKFYGEVGEGYVRVFLRREWIGENYFLFLENLIF